MEKLKGKSFLEKTSSILFNIFYYKIALMFVLIPSLIVYTVNVNYRLLFVMLAWGAVICLHDLFTKRNFLRASGIIWLIGFLVIFGISVVVNFRNSFNLNFSSFGYSVIALLLLYPNSTNNDKKQILKEISVINYIFIGMTTVLSTISLIMFVILYSDTIQRDGMKYYVGWHNNRLFGLYANTGYMISTIALTIIVLQIFVLKALDKKFTSWHKAFFIYSGISAFLSLCMENAKGSFISLAVFVFVFVFFMVYRNFKLKKRDVLKTWITSIVCALVSSALLFGVVYSVRPVLSYVPSIYYSISRAEQENPETSQMADNSEISSDAAIESGEISSEETSDISSAETSDISSEENNENSSDISSDTNLDSSEISSNVSIDNSTNKVNIDRDIADKYGFLTGRPKIWKFGLKEFLKNPIIGYGPQSHREHHIVDDGIRHFHNLIIQSLVSVGLFGSLFIAIFFFKKIWAAFKTLLKKIVSEDKYVLVGMVIFAIVAMLIVNSMSEVTILFLVRFSMFLFWILFGYMITLISDDKKAKEDIWAEKLADNIDNKFKKKN